MTNPRQLEMADPWVVLGGSARRWSGSSQSLRNIL